MIAICALLFGAASAFAQGPITRSVGGIALGSHLSSADPSLGCQPSTQWIGSFWCKAKQYKATARGSLWITKTLLLGADGSVRYVNNEYTPAFWHVNELQHDLADLIRTHPGETQHYIREGNGMIAMWGNVQVRPVDPTARSLIAADRSPHVGILLATVGDLKTAIATNLPIYRVISGEGFVWCANDTPG
jgi:hypothetical protein